MGRHRENITRLVCGVMSITVSLCLLTCAFVNMAYADYNDLPNSYTDETGGNYNPQGLIFGQPDSLFTDPWYADESIFQQSLANVYQLVQDKTTIYTLIIADCVRQSNNWLSQINSNLDTVEDYIDDIYLANNQLLTQIRFNQEVNGTKTLRGIVADISSAMTTNNASLQQIKEQFEDEHGSNYLYQIDNKLRHVDDIWNQLANGTSGTISGTVNSINTKLSYVNNKFDTVINALGSGGYIGQQLADLNATLTTIKNNTAPYMYNDSNGGSVRYFWVSALKPSDGQAQEWMNNVRNYIDNIRNYSANISSKIDTINSNISSIVDSLGSGGYLGQQLALLNTRVLDIYNALTRMQSSWTNNNGGTIWYLRALPLMVNDPSSTTWGTNVRDYLQQIAQKSTYVDLSGISNALSSNGYIGQQLALLNTRVLDIYNALTRIQSSWTGENGGILWYIRAMPVAALDPYTTTWVSDVRSYLQTIANKPVADLSNVNQWLDSIASNLESYHEEIMPVLRQILLKLSIPGDASDIIGDFDKDLFDDNVGDLIGTISTLAPFGAILVASMELSILTQVDPIQKPELVIPFNFTGDDGNVILDLSWLDNALPLFHFIIEFLFILMLLNVTMKYVRQEATS